MFPNPPFVNVCAWGLLLLLGSHAVVCVRFAFPSVVFAARSCSAVGIHFFTLTESPGQEVLMMLQLISACQPLGCLQ